MVQKAIQTFKNINEPMNAPSNMKFFPLKIQERLSGRRVNRAIEDNLSSSAP